MQTKAVLILALIICADQGVVASRNTVHLGAVGLDDGSTSQRDSAGQELDGAGLAERSAAGPSAHAAALGGLAALQRGGQDLDEAALAELPGIADFLGLDFGTLSVQAVSVGDAFHQNPDFALGSKAVGIEIKKLLARSVFFAPPDSLRRIAADRAAAWYLKQYGTGAQRLAYAAALSVRWAVEHPTAAAVGAAAAMGATVFAVWYHRRSKAQNLTKGEEAAAEGAVGRVGLLRSLSDKLAAAAELLRSGSADRTVLLAAQAHMLWAAHAGNCTLQRTPAALLDLPIQPMGQSTFVITPMRLAELTAMPEAQAKEEYPKLKPLTAQCGSRSRLPIRLAWDDPQTLVDQLIRLEIML